MQNSQTGWKQLPIDTAMNWAVSLHVVDFAAAAATTATTADIATATALLIAQLNSANDDDHDLQALLSGSS